MRLPCIQTTCKIVTSLVMMTAVSSTFYASNVSPTTCYGIKKSTLDDNEVQNFMMQWLS